MSDPDTPGKTARRSGTAALSMLGLASQQLSAFAITLLAAGFLAPAEYGVYTLAIVFVELILAFTYTGFYHFIVTSDEDEGAVLPTMFWMMQAVGVAGGAGLVLAAPLLAGLFRSPGLEPVLQLLGLIQPFTSAMAWASAVLIRRQKMRRHFTIMLIQNTLALAGGAVVLVVWQSLFALVLYRYLRVGLGVLLYLLMTPDRPALRFSRRLAAAALRYASGLYGSRLLAFGSNFGTDLLLAYFFSTAESGLYRFANRLAAAVIDIVAQPLRSFALNQFGAAARSGGSLEPVLQRFCGVMVLLMGGFSAMILIYGADIISALFQPSYLAALGALYALTVRAFANFGTSLVEPVFAACNKTHVAMYHNLLWTCVMVAVIFLGSRHGMEMLAIGQAAVAIAASAAALLLFAWQGRIGVRGALRNALVSLAVIAVFFAAAAALWMGLKAWIGVSGVSLILGPLLSVGLALAAIAAAVRLGSFDPRVFADR